MASLGSNETANFYKDFFKKNVNSFENNKSDIVLAAPESILVNSDQDYDEQD